MSRVEDDYESKTNKQVPGDIILHAGKEILEDLADLAQTEQIHDYTPEELEGAAYVAADLYREKRGSEGKLDEKAAKEEAGLLVKADQTGQMDELIPGASTAFAKKGPPQDAPEEEAPVEEDEE